MYGGLVTASRPGLDDPSLPSPPGGQHLTAPCHPAINHRVYPSPNRLKTIAKRRRSTRTPEKRVLALSQVIGYPRSRKAPALAARCSARIRPRSLTLRQGSERLEPNPPNLAPPFSQLLVRKQRIGFVRPKMKFMPPQNQIWPLGDPNQITKRTQFILCFQQKPETKANFHSPGGWNIWKAVGVKLALNRRPEYLP